MKVCSRFTVAICAIGFLIPFTTFSAPIPASKAAKEAVSEKKATKESAIELKENTLKQKAAKEAAIAPKDSITAPAKALSDAIKSDMATMSKTEMVLQLSLTVGQLVGTIVGTIFKALGEADPRNFKPEDVAKIGEFVVGFNQLIIKINNLQAQQITVPGQSKSMGFRTMMSLQNQCRINAQISTEVEKVYPQLSCEDLSCEDKAACTRAIMRDLIGYSYSIDGKTIKVKGVISEMLKVIFIGYKDKEGKKHQSMFELLADLTKMPESTKTDIVQAIRTAKRILKLVSQLTFVEPKVDRQDKE